MKQLITLVSFCLLNIFATFLKAEEVEIKNIIAIKNADWNKDGSMDKAVLALPKINNDTDVTLYIYISDDKEGSTLKKKNMSWTGGMAGTVPSLSTNKSGSLVVHTMNQSMGRGRWHRKVTLSYLNNMFIVSGFSVSSYDTLDHDNNHECDVNLLNGKGEKDGKSFHIEAKTQSLLDWNEDQAPKKCFD